RRPPRYSVAIVNDGLWTCAGSIPRPAARPRTRQVLPAPSSPTRPRSSPPRAARPSAAPRASVSSGLAVATSVARTVAPPTRCLGPACRLEPRQCRRELGDEVAREETDLALTRGDHVARRAVCEDAERGRLEGREPLREQRPHHAGQHVTRAATRHPRVAGGRDGRP